MALAQKKITAILFGLTLALSRGEEASAAKNSLESAKRDLLALPSSNQTVGTSRQNDLKIDVPNVPSANGSGDVRPSMALLPGNSAGASGEYQQPNGAKAPSEGWLIDAFKVADAKARAQRAADDQHSRDMKQIQGKAGGATAVNPFSPYMNQWLSPHDPVLLQITGPNQSSGTSLVTKDSLGSRDPKTSDGTIFAGNSAGSAQGTSSPFSSASSIGSQNPAAGGVTTNPYLPTDAATAGRGSSHYSPPAWTGSKSEGSNQPNSTGGLNPPSSAARKSKLAEPAYTPPTAPLIDERKYFPQLHRF